MLPMRGVMRDAEPDGDAEQNDVPEREPDKNPAHLQHQPEASAALACSTAAISSCVSGGNMLAETFCSSCVRFLAPGMTIETATWLSTNLTASCDNLKPLLAATGLSRSTIAK